MSVLANRMVIALTDHYPGSKAGVDIFYENLGFHRIVLNYEILRRTLLIWENSQVHTKTTGLCWQTKSTRVIKVIYGVYMECTNHDIEFECRT